MSNLITKFANRWRSGRSARAAKRTPPDPHSVLRPLAACVRCSENASCCAEMVYSLEQQIFLVLEFHRLDHSIVETRRSSQRMVNVTKGPKRDTIKALFEKCQRTGNVQNGRAGNVGRLRAAITEANVKVVQQMIQQRPRVSVRRVAAQAELRRMSTHLIIGHSLHLFPYRIQTRQPLSAAAINARETFANAMLQQLDAGEFDVGNIWFSDEEYFSLDGLVNKQNWRNWGTENPHVALPSSLKPPKVRVWATISSKGLIVTFFRLQTITAALYLDILREFVAVQNVLEDHRNTSWFMHEGARQHRTATVFDLLNEHFDISLDYYKHTGRGMDWAPYSPDLTPVTFFCGGT